MRLVSVDEMREIEAKTFASGTSGEELQARAGQAVAAFVARRSTSPGRVVALVGSGNNGRDAFIAARELRADGWDATLYLTPRHAVTEDELHAFVQIGGGVLWHPDGFTGVAMDTALQQATVVVDGLLGIGARGAPRPPLDEIIVELNRIRTERRELFVVAVDAPSGVDADSGAASLAVVADATVVLGGMKKGLVAPEAFRYTGELVPADIGVMDGPQGAPEIVTAEFVGGLLPRPSSSAHKGSFGRLLVVAGSADYIGAAYLVCAAAVRAGAGIVTLAAPPSLRDVVASRLAEVTFLPLPEGGPAAEPEECAHRVVEQIDTFNGLAIGPGLSTKGGVGDFVESVLRARARAGLNAVVDADALNVLSERPDWPSWIGSGVVMTPHLGELRRLAHLEDGEQPWETASRLSNEWRVCLVIKGPCTAIGTAGETWIHARPNPALATGGTGDVLTGITGGLLTRGLQTKDAARLAVWVHGEAGAALAKERAAGGLMASELLPQIPAALMVPPAPLPLRQERGR